MEFYFNTNFLNIGTCSLHPAHTAYRKGLECLSFDADGFFCDLHFFFKLSSARREDYRALQEVTDVIAHFMLSHISSRWLTIKDVAVRVLEQYPNLREYFLRALPKQKGFKQLQKTDRYQRITKLLKDPLTQFYIAFCAFSANECNDFLVPFQSNEPKIHLLFPSICKLVSSIMMKYMKKRVLSDDHCENVKLCETDKQNQKGLNLIDVGTKCKMLLSDPSFIVENDKLRKECQKLYLTVTSYLKANFLFDKPFTKHAQYLHPEKRHEPAALNSISNLALTICHSLGDKYPQVFNLPSRTTKEDIVDQVRSQWRIYRSESIPEHWYKVSPKSVKKNA